MVESRLAISAAIKVAAVSATIAPGVFGETTDIAEPSIRVFDGNVFESMTMSVATVAIAAEVEIRAHNASPTIGRVLFSAVVANIVGRGKKGLHVPHMYWMLPLL